MKPAALLLLATLLPAQQPLRRAVAPSAANGWARVVVDDDGAGGVWIGDADGRSVPFLWESDARWSSFPLAAAHPVWGKDGKGRPTGAFTLQPPQGFARGDREQVKLEFTLQTAEAPWACRVEVARRGDGGTFVAMDDAPRFLYDLGAERRATSITIPWDADDWRVTLIPVQGAAPKLMGVAASACTLPSELSADERLDLVFQSPSKASGFPDTTFADLGRTRRLTALEVTLRPPVAPVVATVDAVSPSSGGTEPGPRFLGSGELWNLPALDTRSVRVPLEGEARYLHLGLPDGVAVQSATALIRHRRLFFPAEAGKVYFLHDGGLAKAAPGSLGALPASSRAFYAGAPLTLSAAEADPQAVLPAPDPAARLRSGLPWAVGILVLLLGFWGFRLLKAPQD